jgi:hypothetical protein
VYLTTVRIKRAQARSLEAVLTAAQIKAIPRDKMNRADALTLYVAGKIVAVVSAAREAQELKVVWRHEHWNVPTTDVIALAKLAITAMDGAVTGKLVDDANAADAEALAEPVARRGRGRARAGATG